MKILHQRECYWKIAIKLDQLHRGYNYKSKITSIEQFYPIQKLELDYIFTV